MANTFYFYELILKFYEHFSSSYEHFLKYYDHLPKFHERKFGFYDHSFSDFSCVQRIFAMPLVTVFQNTVLGQQPLDEMPIVEF